MTPVPTDFILMVTEGNAKLRAVADWLDDAIGEFEQWLEKRWIEKHTSHGNGD